MEATAEVTDEDYPFILTTGGILFHHDTGTMTRRSPTLNAEVPTGYVEINPEDAAELGIAKGDMVKVRTRRGEVTTPAKVTQDIPKGILFMLLHFKEEAANVLTNSALTRLLRCLNLRSAQQLLKPLEGGDKKWLKAL